MTASLYYGEIERESNREDVAYDDTYIGIRLRSDLRSLFSSSGQRQLEPASFGKAQPSKFKSKPVTER